MRRYWAVLLFTAAAGCGGDQDEAGLEPSLARGADPSGVLRVTAFAQGPGVDTTSTTVRGAVVVVRRADSIPDTSSVAVALRADTAPPPPPDTVPPPPPPDTTPPPAVCNAGRVVAQGRTNGAGFDQFRLPVGRYDVEVIPPAGAPLARGAACGVPVPARRPMRITITLPALVDSTG